MKQTLFNIVILCLSANLAIAQSIIDKFVEQKFVLGDSKKSAEGNYYVSQSYLFEKGKILMISTQGKLNDSAIYTRVVVKGTNEKNEEIVPETILHSSREIKTEDIFLFKERGNYTIYIVNDQPGQKGEITNRMSLGWTSWIDSGQIFRLDLHSPFAQALGKVLGHSIFQFNLMRDPQKGSGAKPLIVLPGADMNSTYTLIRFNEKHLDGKGQPHLARYSCCYFLDEAQFPIILQEGGYRFPEFEKNYNFKDSSRIINQYERYKQILKEALHTDFVIEAESVNKISNGMEGEMISGRSIVFKYKQPRPILDPRDGGKYSFLFDHDIRVSLTLICNNASYDAVGANLLLNIYSY